MHQMLLKMLKSITTRVSSTAKRVIDKQPVVRQNEAVRKPIEDILGETKEKFPLEVSADPGKEVADLSGVPDEHKEERFARIFRPTREATQTAWNNTKVWKIELDTRQRWENPLMGWASSGDPLSNISGNLDFASKEDAVAFCQKNRWNYDVEEVHERKIIPKQYGTNFSWNKRSRISTK